MNVVNLLECKAYPIRIYLHDSLIICCFYCNNASIMKSCIIVLHCLKICKDKCSPILIALACYCNALVKYGINIVLSEKGCRLTTYMMSEYPILSLSEYQNCF